MVIMILSLQYFHVLLSFHFTFSSVLFCTRTLLCCHNFTALITQNIAFEQDRCLWTYSVFANYSRYLVLFFMCLYGECLTFGCLHVVCEFDVSCGLWCNFIHCMLNKSEYQTQ